MKRRQFLGTALAAVPLATCGSAEGPAQPKASAGPLDVRLAGVTLSELRTRYRQELFEEFLPFWDRYGIDHERGGFMCGLDHDGTRANDDKFHWFQGRGIWLYSYLYNHFGQDPQHLEVARKTKDFLLRYFPQPDGWWAAVVAGDGQVLQPYSGDQYGMYFGVEGLLEYAAATGNEKLREQARELWMKLYSDMNRRDFRADGTGAPGQRPQGLWMVNLQLSTQYLRRWDDPEIARISDHSVDMIINQHWNPDIGLNTEVLEYDGSRPAGRENYSGLGHGVEILWMIMDEARRRKDDALFALAAERMRRHFEVGWDHVYGGLCEAVNVDQGCYEWPVERPVGMTVEFRMKGEYNYMKSMWTMDEALIAMLMVFEETGAQWAADYFGLVQQTIDRKYSLKPHGYPLWLVFADRRLTFQPHTMRKENYHHPRQCLLNLRALDRMISKQAEV